MQDEEINNLIAKYIDGEATVKEAQFVDDFYNSFEAKQGLISLMSEDEIQAAVNKSFEKFKARIHPKF